MALDGTYAGLQASVADWLNRADLTAQIPDFIVLTHADINLRLRVRQMMARVPLTIATELVALPADFVAPISLRIEGQGVLSSIDPDAMAEQKRQAADVSGLPTAYAVVGSNFEFGPVPGQSYTGLLDYYQQVPALGGLVTTNWLLAAAPATYLYGALTQSAPFLKDDARIATWGQLYLASIQALQQMNDRYGERLSPRAPGTVMA